MTRSPLWREFESGENILLRFLRQLILWGGFLFLIFAGVLDLTWPQQCLLGLLSLVVAIWMDRASTSYLVTLTLMLLSCFSTFRYGYWRISTVINFFGDPANAKWTPLDAFFIWMLVAAECYSFAILFLGYLQTLWPLRRTPVPLPEDTDLWPEVDLLIPTYNEPLNVVRYTALAAMNIDWPADKLNVYILDDGKREEFRAFAEEAGIGYMTRDDNAHAKAGNINRALERLDAPFVAIFDSDHVPTRSFLQLTMGWFGRDSQLGLLQTPHHFYSPDPFERNLGQFRVIPNEGELFYGVVQDGNDFWNATFFCGSCAVIRRSALNEIGGIAVETVTEDAHTSLRMQMRGWNTAYINIPQAAGLATERLSGHVKQRIRWARGMIQILRTDNPLFAPGLTPWQRLCYFNAMTHFLYALPRLIFLTSPLIYLILWHTNIPGYWAAIFAFALPHLVLSAVTNSRIQGQHRHSFWNEIYETVLAPYIFLPTMMALVNPKLGSFNVTAKGGVVNRSFFDTRIAQPFLVLLLLNIIGLVCAIPRALLFPSFDLQPTAHYSNAVMDWIVNIPNMLANLPHNMYDGGHPGTIFMNVLWTIFNIIILGVATAVAWESQQRRQTVRVTMAVPANIVMPDGAIMQSVTTDLSSGGVMLLTEYPVTIEIGAAIDLVFPVLDGDATLPATVVGVDGRTLRAYFDPLTMQEEEALTMVLYSRAGMWLGGGEAREADKPLLSMWRILQLSYYGLTHTARGMMTSRKNAPKAKLATSIAPLLLLCAFLPGLMPHASAQTSPLAAGAPVQIGGTNDGVQAGPVTPGTFDNIFTLADFGPAEPIVLRGVDAYHSVYFSVPQTQVVKTATMKLRYHFSPGLIPSLSHLKVSLNGTLFATLPVVVASSFTGSTENNLTDAQTAVARQNENNALLEATLTLPAEMLVHQNELTFEFIGHYTTECEDPSHTALWSHVDSNSSIELKGNLLPLQNDLKLLPLPFYDAAVNLHPSIPIVFLAQPSAKALQAAGIVASWFGIMTNSHAVRFPVSVGTTLPQSNAIVIGESAADLPTTLGVTASSGPTIAMRTNPFDPYSKVLVLTGDNPDDLLMAAKALTLQGDTLAGDMQTMKLIEPRKREPDDAPRWLSTEHVTTLGEIAQQGDLQGDSSAPIQTYFRVPPDLYLNYGAKQDLAFQMNYRYNGIPLANESTLQVYMNDAYVSSTPMPHTNNASSILSTIVPVPNMDMRPFSNSMKMQFVFQIAKKGRCMDSAPMNLQGAILKSSYLDIRDIPHWVQMPNLEIFANAGYPFTRLADLADTAVVLPDQASAEEIEMYLTLMGHFGAQTGYPVLNVSVTNADGMKTDNAKDYLLMGTADDLSGAIAKVSDNLPVKVSSAGLKIEDTQGFFANAWWKVPSSDRVESGKLEISNGVLPDALVEGIQWPSHSGRSVVVIALRDKSVVPNFLSVFLKYSQSSDISQSVSVLKGERFVSYRIGTEAYNVGSLSPWIQINLLFSRFPWLPVAFAVFVCFLMAVLLRAILRRRARRRLLGVE
jgi:cellulose synthase (UDP-forming)